MPIRTEWELDLPQMHRALLDLCRERTTHAEQAELEGMSEAQLAAMLRDFMREEYVTIPAGTPVVPCRSCGALVCRLPFHDRHYRSSFVVDGPECQQPTDTEAGSGYHHIADCPGSGLVQMARAAEVEPLLPAAARQVA